MTAAPTKRTTLPTLQTAITKTRAQHAASPPTTLPVAGGGGPPALQPAQRQTDAGASLCSIRRFTACTLPSAINDFQIEPGVRRPYAAALHAKRHGPACKTARPCMQNSTARHNRPCPSNAPIDSRHVASLYQVQPQAFCTMGEWQMAARIGHPSGKAMA